MLRTEVRRCVVAEVDLTAGVPLLADLEEAALEFARTAPALMIAETIQGLVGGLLDAVIGPFGLPLADEDQPPAPWACTGCGSVRGFRRRGLRPGGRRVVTRCGRVRLDAVMVFCRSCGSRFSPIGQLLGLDAYQRRTDGLAELAAGLAVEVAYAKASRLLKDLAGVELSPRSLRREVLRLAPDQIGPDPTLLDVPVLLLDGTGVRAGESKCGVGLHLAVGLIARRRRHGRVVVEARLLAATIGEPWPVLADLLAGVRPGLVIVDGEPELVTLAHHRFPEVPVQRCLWHLKAGMAKQARYTDRADPQLIEDSRRRLNQLLTDAYRTGDQPAAEQAYMDLVDHLDCNGAPAAAGHLHAAIDDALRFLTNPDAGRLVFGHKGRPDLGTGVLERVMREMNRRTDVGVRWSVPGVRRLLTLKLQRKYRHGPWAPKTGPTPPNPVRFRLTH